MTLRTWWPCLIITICLTALGCNSQQNSGTADSADSPAQLIENVEAALQALDAYSFDLDVAWEVTAQGVEQKVDSQYDVKIEKPNRWAILLKSGMMGGSTVSDGENLTSFSQMLQKYAVEPLTESQIAETTGAGLSQSFMLLGAGGFAQFFMGNGLKEEMLGGVTDSVFGENELIDGATCRVAKFQQENGMNWEVAVETGPRPLVRQFVLKPDFEKIAAQQPGMPADMQLKVTLNFNDWKTDVQFTGDDFVFIPPPGAEKVDSLFGRGGGGQEQHSLVGEQAPSFSAKDLNGQTVELDQFAGQDVVILDFWATWCGPCVDALPIIARVAEKFQDKHVVFYAVNQGESSETIREFLTGESLDVQVLLDQEGAIGNLFQVSGIPQTVIIDTKGRVQVVHVGFGGNLEQQFTKELEDILAGKDLATTTKEEQEP